MREDYLKATNLLFIILFIVLLAGCSTMQEHSKSRHHSTKKYIVRGGQRMSVDKVYYPYWGIY